MKRTLILIYGIICYAIFFPTFCYLMAFSSGVWVPKHVDTGIFTGFKEALIINTSFLSLFVVQHTVMARPAFKNIWTKLVPKPAERSTFVLASCLIFIPMFVFWKPMPQTIWHIEHAVLSAIIWALCLTGWGIALYSTFLINHYELFGLKQVIFYFRNEQEPATPFKEKSLYKIMRHPLMFGIILALWSTPHMTAGHLYLAAMSTVYILIGTRLEERDLKALHGESYSSYQQRIPMILPLGFLKKN